jgi:hypothetical protein
MAVWEALSCARVNHEPSTLLGNRLSSALSSLMEGPGMVVWEALSCAGVMDDPSTLLGNRLTNAFALSDRGVQRMLALDELRASGPMTASRSHPQAKR